MAFSSDQALEFLLSAEKRGRLAHTFLVSGPEGSGKRKLAEELFKAVNHRPNALGHPDFHRIEPESKARRILVEQIRSLEASLQMKSAEAVWKFGVVLDADRLMPQAANAFLKTLEEPPAHSILILLSAIPEGLLGTIRSRCVQITLRRVGPSPLEPEAVFLLDAVADFFETENFSVAGALRLARKLEEALGQIRSRIETEQDALFRQDQQTYKNATDGRWLAEAEDRQKALIESRYVRARSALLWRLQEWLGDVVRHTQGVEELDLPAYREKTLAAAQRVDLPAILERIAALESLHEHFSRNVQENLAIEVTFLHAFGPRRGNRRKTNAFRNV
jgi:DNA polymerase III subunit delta'